MKKCISVVVPAYNEEKSLPYFYKEICKVAKKLSSVDFEFIFVNDVSKDKTLDLLKDYNKKDDRVKFLSFSRNFGKEAAMIAGLEYSKGDYVVVMDADLQHPPALIETMYNSVIDEGYDCVATRRTTRKGESKLKSFFAIIFYKIINKISKVEMVSGAMDYRFMTRKMVDAIISMKEYNRYSKGIFSFVGFDTKWIEYENIERVAGQSKWSFLNLFKYAIEGIVSFSTIPLGFSIVIGIIMFIVSIILLVYMVIKSIILSVSISKLLLIITLVMFFVGIQLVCIGIASLYLSKAYLEIKKRPIYIVKETEKDLK